MEQATLLELLDQIGRLTEVVEKMSTNIVVLNEDLIVTMGKLDRLLETDGQAREHGSTRDDDMGDSMVAAGRFQSYATMKAEPLNLINDKSEHESWPMTQSEEEAQDTTQPSSSSAPVKQVEPLVHRRGRDTELTTLESSNTVSRTIEKKKRKKKKKMRCPSKPISSTAQERSRNPARSEIRDASCTQALPKKRTRLTTPSPPQQRKKLKNEPPAASCGSNDEADIRLASANLRRQLQRPVSKQRYPQILANVQKPKAKKNIQWLKEGREWAGSGPFVPGSDPAKRGETKRPGFVERYNEARNVDAQLAKNEAKKKALNQAKMAARYVKG